MLGTGRGTAAHALQRVPLAARVCAAGSTAEWRQEPSPSSEPPAQVQPPAPSARWTTHVLSPPPRLPRHSSSPSRAAGGQLCVPLLRRRRRCHRSRRASSGLPPRSPPGSSSRSSLPCLQIELPTEIKHDSSAVRPIHLLGWLRGEQRGHHGQLFRQLPLPTSFLSCFHLLCSWGPFPLVP